MYCMCGGIHVFLWVSFLYFDIQYKSYSNEKYDEWMKTNINS